MARRLLRVVPFELRRALQHSYGVVVQRLGIARPGLGVTGIDLQHPIEQRIAR